MSHTNSTTNYSLPQFLTSDKPAWLTDINNAFSDIDTGMHNAQTKANTADSNATQALSDAAGAASAASAADAKGAGAVASIESAFDSTATYAVGDKVMYNSLLYRCIVAVTTPGSWTGSTNWERITVDSMINTNTAAIATNTSDISVLQTAVAGKGDKPTQYTTSSNSVTVQFAAIGGSAILVVNRGYNAYDGVFVLLTGTNNNNAQIVEIYKGSSIGTTYKAPNGLGFTIGSDEMASSAVTIIPIKGTFTVSG